jgi:threonine dehydratase
VNPVFLNSPQFQSDGLSARVKHPVVVKVETVNPVRSFKGRGAWLAASELVASGEADEQHGIVVASSGNFGQAMAYAGRAHRVPVTVFVDAKANPVKVARTRGFGAQVILIGRDFDEAHEHARTHARKTGQTLVTDGRETSFAVGAGTIGLEVTNAVAARRLPAIDTIYVPVGNGALIVGIGTWLRHASPSTRIIGVQAEGAPSMTLSWKAGRPVETERVETYAEGLATRVPVPEAVEAMATVVDDMVLVSEEALIEAQHDLTTELGVLVEGAGAAAWAACLADSASRSASLVIVTGSNIRTSNE